MFVVTEGAGQFLVCGERRPRPVPGDIQGESGSGGRRPRRDLAADVVEGRGGEAVSGKGMVSHAMTVQAEAALRNAAMFAHGLPEPAQRMAGGGGVAGVAALRDGPVLEGQVSRGDGVLAPGAGDQENQGPHAQHRHAPHGQSAPRAQAANRTAGCDLVRTGPARRRPLGTGAARTGRPSTRPALPLTDRLALAGGAAPPLRVRPQATGAARPAHPRLSRPHVGGRIGLDQGQRFAHQITPENV